MSNTSEQIADFFNRLAPTYANRYDEQCNPWLAYWFGERLDKALSFLPHPEASVLDVGCGAGTAYDRLQRLGHRGEYWGCDISEQMLEGSSIPAGKRIHGSPTDTNFPALQVDLILVLGVSSYWGRAELDALLASLPRYLRSGGRVVISFTDPAGWDYRLRRWLRPLFQALGLRKRVAGRRIHAYASEDVSLQRAPDLYPTHHYLLPGTFPLLAPLSPQLNLAFSRLLPHPPPTIFRTDFLLVLEKK